MTKTTKINEQKDEMPEDAMESQELEVVKEDIDEVGDHEVKTSSKSNEKTAMGSEELILRNDKEKESHLGVATPVVENVTGDTTEEVGTTIERAKPSRKNIAEDTSKGTEGNEFETRSDVKKKHNATNTDEDIASSTASVHSSRRNADTTIENGSQKGSQSLGNEQVPVDESEIENTSYSVDLFDLKSDSRDLNYEKPQNKNEEEFKNSEQPQNTRDEELDNSEQLQDLTEKGPEKSDEPETCTEEHLETEKQDGKATSTGSPSTKTVDAAVDNEIDDLLNELKLEMADEQIDANIQNLALDEPVYIYTSLAGGGIHMPRRTNRLATILTANEIKFSFRDCGTDVEARQIWKTYSRGRLLPGIVRGTTLVGNWQEIDEANEEYRLREMIYSAL